MAKALANLNVRLGFIFDDKSLARVEKNLQRTGDRLARTGQNISLFISAPLALMGGAAIKAAGEFESLSLAMQATFKNAGRTVAEAGAEVEALRKAALAPGLDFPQAVAASIRLQSVGLSAEKARDTIKELANAVASTGGTAQQLESVTVQMAQMISKGKVLSGDLRIIQENLPIISDLMLKAFGTSNAEAIQELGITGKDFVTGITAEMTKLTRVSGGISNALVNAGSAIKQALAGIGEEIARTFNITKLSDKFSAALTSIVAGFKGLSDGTKKAIVVFGGLLVAIGPVTLAFGALASVGSTLIGVWRGLISPISSVISGYQAVANAMALAQKETVLLSRATKAAEISTRTTAVAAKVLEVNLLGMQAALTRVKLALGIVGIVAGLAVAVYAMSESFDAAEFAANKFSESQKEIISQTSEEIGLINQSFAALKDETKGRFEKGKVVDQLLKQYPEYLKGIDLETASVSRLTEIQNGLNGAILRGVAERQKAAAVTSVYEKQAQILLRIQQLKDGAQRTTSETGLIDTGDLISAGGNSTEAIIIKLKKQSEDLGKQAVVLADQFDRTFSTIGGAAAKLDPALQAEYDMRDAAIAAEDALYDNKKAVKENTLTKSELAAATRDHNKALKESAELEYAQYSRLEAAKAIVDAIAASYKAMDQAAIDAAKSDEEARAESLGAVDTTFNGPSSGGQALEGGGFAGITTAAPLELGSNLATLPPAMTEVQQAMLGLSEGLIGFNEAFSIVSESVSQNGTLMQNIFLGMGNAISQAAQEGTASFAALGLAAAGAAAKIVRAYIQQGVAAAVAKALGSLPFPFNLAAGAAAGGLAAALFTKAIGAIGVKGFAKGTKDAPGGLSLVGERGPELVNLPRHSQVYTASQTSAMLNGVGGGGAMNISGEFSVRGTDLVLVLDRAQQKQTRTR